MTKYAATNAEPEVPDTVVDGRWINGVAWVSRVAAVAFMGLTVVTFTLLASYPDAGPSLELPRWRGLLIATAAVAAAFAGAIGWRWREPMGQWVPRVLALLRWQVALGAAMAFSIAALADGSRRLIEGVIGLYFLLNVIPLVVLTLISLRLERHEKALAEQRQRLVLEHLLALQRSVVELQVRSAVAVEHTGRRRRLWEWLRV